MTEDGTTNIQRVAVWRIEILARNCTRWRSNLKKQHSDIDMPFLAIYLAPCRRCTRSPIFLCWSRPREKEQKFLGYPLYKGNNISINITQVHLIIFRDNIICLLSKRSWLLKTRIQYILMGLWYLWWAINPFFSFKYQHANSSMLLPFLDRQYQYTN